MKKKLLFIFTIFLSILFIGNVNADNITIKRFVDVINKGDITKEFLETAKKSYKEIYLDAELIDDNSFILNYSAEYARKNEYDEMEYGAFSNSITFVFDSETDILEGERTYDTKTEKADELVVNVMKLVPLWTVEASSKYENIKGYIGKDSKITSLNNIFDRCYMEKMGVCYTEVTHYNEISYVSKVEMSDKGADYAISQYKVQEREKEDDAFMDKLFKVFIVLIILVVFFSIIGSIVNGSNTKKQKKY